VPIRLRRAVFGLVAIAAVVAGWALLHRPDPAESVPLGVKGVRLVPHLKSDPDISIEQYGGLPLGSFGSFDLAGLHRELKAAVEGLRARLPSSITLYEVELAVELDDPTKLPRSRILVGRWMPKLFEDHVGSIVRRSRALEIVLPKALDGMDVGVYVYNVGGECRPLGLGGGQPLQYVPWQSGVYWVLACHPDECWVVAATRHEGT
jgi:hypothetical protein